MLNILLRTSRRPKGFERVIKSIAAQKNGTPINLIISSDNDETTEYINDITAKYNVNKIIVHFKHTKSTGANNCPYNLYFNDMIKHTKEGWVWRIDDDDIISPNAFKTIMSTVVNIDNVYIFKMIAHGGMLLPRYKAIIFGNIGTPNSVIHTQYNNVCKWTDLHRGDFTYIHTLTMSINDESKIKYIDKIIYKVDGIGDGTNIDSTNEFNWDGLNI